MTLTTHAHVPPGFRFHPTDEELINFYLKKKVALEKFDLDHVIREVDLNKLEPWDLHERCKVDSVHQTEWYFFSHKDKKYPTGTRTNRATTAGFWKATGRDKAVHSNCQRIGMRKTLVFYKGRAPHGQKTDWIMHEYRLEDGDFGSRGNEEGWVVCRVFKKRNYQEKAHHSKGNLSEEEQPGSVAKAEYIKRSCQENSSQTRIFVCKQEMEECPAQVPFLQLPQLESPKITSNAAQYIASDSRRMFTENNKKAETFSSEGPAMEDYAQSPYLCNDNLPVFGDSGNLEDWSLYDNIAKYQLELGNFTGDISQCPQASRHQSLEYPSSYEVNLWNFTG